MTDVQIAEGILQNDSSAWRALCRKAKPMFDVIVGRLLFSGGTSGVGIDDVFQDSCIILMQKIKSGNVTINREGALLSYLVQIGKLTAFNIIRKGSHSVATEAFPEIGVDADELKVSEKQQTQDEFLDRVFDSIPDDCKMLLKKFYWDHKPMDEIASMLGLRNADTAKTKKNRCMNKFKDIATRLIGDEARYDQCRHHGDICTQAGKQTYIVAIIAPFPAKYAAHVYHIFLNGHDQHEKEQQCKEAKEYC